MESSTPIIRPSPRISRMKGNFAASAERPSRNSVLRALMFSRSFSSSMTLRNSRAVAHASGPPPKVVPCKPGETFWATASEVKYRAERKTSGKRFGYYHDVGLRGKFLIGKVSARAAQAALNFVGDQQRAVFCGQRPRAVPEFVADRIDSAFTLNGFEEDGADGVIKFGFEIGDVVEVDKFDPRHQRGKRQAIFFSRGDAHGAKGAAVKRVFER